MNKQTLLITYCSNYNDVYFHIDNEYIIFNNDFDDMNVTEQLANQLTEIYEQALSCGSDNCNEHGYYGDLDQLEVQVINIANNILGDQFELKFSVDSTST